MGLNTCVVGLNTTTFWHLALQYLRNNTKSPLFIILRIVIFFLIVFYHNSQYTLNVIAWIRLTIITPNLYFTYPIRLSSPNRL